MKKIVSGMAIALSAVLLLAGCTTASSPHTSVETLPDSGPTVVHEDASVELVRAMMELDYEPMTVAKFNETIQQLCADADTTVFEVMSDVYDHFSVYDDAGEFVGTVFSDRALDAFMDTTLEYSAQEIFGEPVYFGSVMYMTMPGMTAMEMYEKQQQMRPDEGMNFLKRTLR